MFTPFATAGVAALSAWLALYLSGSGVALQLVIACGWLATFLVSLALPRPPALQPIAEAEYESLVPSPPASATQGALYLDMVKRVLLNIVYHEQSYQVSLTRSRASGEPRPRLARAFSLRHRILGEDVSLNTLSMIGLERLDNVQMCVEAVLSDGVEGDLVETGCAKGGACILMRAVLRARKDKSRRVFCCDTFSEMSSAPRAAAILIFRPLWEVLRLISYIPSAAWHRWLYTALMRLQSSFPVDTAHLSRDTVDSFLFLLRHAHSFTKPPVPATGHSLAAVRSHFARLGLLDDRVVFLKGFFSDTLPHAPIPAIALLRLDGDLYGSTMDALVHLYPRVSAGGFVVVDDYYSFDECRAAVDEYRLHHDIVAPLVRIDAMSVYWRVPSR